MLILNFVFVIIGFIFLMKGADLLVDGATAIAKKFHIPEIVIGLTIVAIGTSMPELMVSAQAALEGHADLSIGNVVGSNLANLLLILGTCAILHDLPFKKSTAKIENPMMLGVTFLLFILANFNGEAVIKRSEGMILLGICIAYILYNVMVALKSEKVEEENSENMPMLKAIVFIIIGIIGLKLGGDLVVEHASAIAKALGVSEKVIGLTIVSIATSLPELVTSLTATKKGVVDIAIGNIIGSNIFNIVLILGVASIISPIHYSLSYNRDLIFLMLISISFIIFPFIKKSYKMNKIEGIIYVFLYVAYMTFLVING